MSQCLGLVSGLLPHIRAALMAQLPRKQHSLLADLDKIKQDIQVRVCESPSEELRKPFFNF